jgi:hypothetical protein
MTNPDLPTHNRHFAPIEDLDPEPATRVRRGHRWEFALGVLLVLGLAGVGGWQWWQGQAKLAAYQAGARAAANGDWDSAYAAYGRAEGYADATARAAAAGQTIARRNAQYGSAAAAAQAGNWPAALQAIRQVQQIAPHYWDTAQISQEAQQHVYTAALSDAVVLRPTAAPPGLYIYTAGGWRWLQGSDSLSRVQATCADGEIIFDAAPSQPAVTPTPLPAPSLLRPRGNNYNSYVERRLLGSRPDGTADPRGALAFDPLYHYLCTAGGLWGESALAPQDNPLPRDLVVFGPFAWTYQPFGGQPITPTLPGPAWAVLGPTPDGQQMLLLDGTDIGAPNLHARLYLADPNGGNRRPLGDFSGGVMMSSFSPDAHYLLLTMREAETATTRLLDLTGSQPARVLAQGNRDPRVPYYYDAFGAFLGLGAQAADGLLTWTDGSQRHIRLIDPTHPDTPLIDTQLAIPSLSAYPFGPSIDASGLLLNIQALDGLGAEVRQLLVYIDPAGQIHTFDPGIKSSGDFVGNAWLQDERLIFAISGISDSAGTGFPYTLFSVPLSQLDSPAPSVTAVYTGTYKFAQPDTPTIAPVPTFHLGPSVLAYTTASGDLHARTYDGAIDLLLESGVTALYKQLPYGSPYDYP